MIGHKYQRDNTESGYLSGCGTKQVNSFSCGSGNEANQLSWYILFVEGLLEPAVSLETSLKILVIGSSA